MKKLFSLLACLTLLLSLSVLAYAEGEGRYGREAGTPGYVNKKAALTDSAVVSRPCEIYAITLYPTSTNTSVAVYDTTSAITDQTELSKLAAELGEASQYQSKRYEYDPPLNMESGVYVDVTSCYVIVEYR